jgi:hypothetical protein
MEAPEKKTQETNRNPTSFISKQKLFVAIAIVAVVLTAGFVYSQFIPQGGSNIKLAQGFPVIPIYPGATLSKSASDPHEGVMYIGVKYSATWTSKAQVPDISKWYLEKLKASGWTVDTLPANSEASDVQLITLYNKTYNLNMSFTRDQNTGLTTITSEFSTNYKDFCNNMYGKPCSD